jgi:hypothetical protein
MEAKSRLFIIMVPAVLLLTAVGRGGEDPATVKDHVSYTASKKLKETLAAKRQALAKKRKADVKKFTELKTAEFEEARKENTFIVKIGDKEFKVKEPQRVSEVPKIASKRFRTWGLLAKNFKFDLPAEVFVSRIVGPKNLIGKDKVFLVLPFTLTNTLINIDVKDPDGKLIGSSAVNTPEELALIKAKVEKDGNSLESKPAPARLSLGFMMVTDKGAFTPEASGFLAHEAVEFSTFKRRAWTKELVSFVRKSDVVGELKPGETRAGVAVFPRFDPETTVVRILVEGLTNDYDFKRDLRKAMILEFVRPGNVYYPGQVKLKFKRRIGGKLMDPKSAYVPKRDEEVHHGFDWVWLWNWDAAVTVGQPKLSENVASPVGKDKFNFWTYKVKLANRTGKERPLSIEMVRTIVKVKIKVAGKEREVEVPLVDDGKMNVYKAAFFETEGIAIKSDRFPKVKRVESGKDGGVEFTVAFRERDVDFEAVIRNIHNQLDLEVAIKRNKDGKRTEKVFKGPRHLSVAEVKEVQKQLKAKLPAALKAQLAKGVRAEITAKSGLSSGRRLVNITFSLAGSAAADQ